MVKPCPVNSGSGRTSFVDARSRVEAYPHHDRDHFSDVGGRLGDNQFGESDFSRVGRVDGLRRIVGFLGRRRSADRRRSGEVPVFAAKCFPTRIVCGGIMNLPVRSGSIV